jgi:hypothetical protein
VEQFLEIRRLSSEDGIFDYQIDVLCILADKDVSYFEELELDELGELISRLNLLTQSHLKNIRIS